MCFFTNTNKFKIAKRPIRVYKWLTNDDVSPFYGYNYHKGLNTPIEKTIKERYIFPYIVFESGVLHGFKKRCMNSDLVKMYITKGANYNDNGIHSLYQDSRDEIISTALYWPKNKFEAWWYNLISKKY